VTFTLRQTDTQLRDADNQLIEIESVENATLMLEGK
jgi:hypothetical protein